MMIKASGRSALMVVMGLFVCLAGVSYTNAASEAAGSKSESATATKSVKQGYAPLEAHRASQIRPDRAKIQISAAQEG